VIPRWLLASGLLALLGTGVSINLTIVHYDEAALICGVGDCSTVQNSRYAEVAGVPIAVFGMLMYATILGLAIYRWRQPAATQSDTLTSLPHLAGNRRDQSDLPVVRRLRAPHAWHSPRRGLRRLANAG
jgi:uncharacterized membrane protein